MRCAIWQSISSSVDEAEEEGADPANDAAVLLTGISLCVPDARRFNAGDVLVRDLIRNLREQPKHTGRSDVFQIGHYLQLYAHQKESVAFALKLKAFDASDPGTGKTAVQIELFRRRR